MICRLCLVESTSEVLSIFDDKGIQLQIAEIISKHFWFRPSKEDSISDTICSSCWTKVASFHEFYCFIEYAQKKLVNNLQSKCSSSWLTESLPLSLNELKEEEISSKSDEDTSNDCLSRNIMSSEYVEAVIGNDDPLIEENIKVETNSSDNGFRNSEIPIHSELVHKANQQKKIRNASVESSDDSYNTESESDDTDIKIISKKRGPYKKSLNKQQDDIQKALRKQEKLNARLAKRKKIEEEDEQIAKFVKMECDICFENFKCFSELKNHLKEKHSLKKGYVVCCNKQIKKRNALLDHVNFHINFKSFPCTICDKKLSTKQNLSKHILTVHNKDESKKFNCNQCQKSFYKDSSLKRHKLTHTLPEERNFRCDLCGKAYPSKSHLGTHIREVHKKAYYRVCDICGKIIKGKASMERHLLEHSGVKEPKVQCQKCGSWLKGERNLKMHMRYHEETLLGLKCHICGRQVRSKGGLRDHVKNMHETERTFKCTFCEKAFKREKTLMEHMTTHTGGALYTCTFCPRTFNADTNMYQHRKKAHPKEWKELNIQRISLLPRTTSNTQ